MTDLYNCFASAIAAYPSEQDKYTKTPSLCSAYNTSTGSNEFFFYVELVMSFSDTRFETNTYTYYYLKHLCISKVFTSHLSHFKVINPDLWKNKISIPLDIINILTFSDIEIKILKTMGSSDSIERAW